MRINGKTYIIDIYILIHLHNRHSLNIYSIVIKITRKINVIRRNQLEECFSFIFSIFKGIYNFSRWIYKMFKR